MNLHSISGLLVCVNFFSANEYHLLIIISYAVLDPRISYMALKDEFVDDLDLANHLEDAKANLQAYFKQNYSRPSPQANSSLSAPSLSSVASTSMSQTSISGSSGSPQKNFTARFQRKRSSPDELLEFWSLPQEDFETIDPLQWWLGRRAQFPQLYRLARDIFSIPGVLS
jgi:hAT family C-terminal dimerisation region